MNFLADSLVAGLVVLLGGFVALLVTLIEQHKALDRIAMTILLFLVGISILGMDAKVPWPLYLETCVAATAILVIIAAVRYGQRQLAEGEYDTGESNSFGLPYSDDVYP